MQVTNLSIANKAYRFDLQMSKEERLDSGDAAALESRFVCRKRTVELSPGQSGELLIEMDTDLGSGSALAAADLRRMPCTVVVSSGDKRTTAELIVTGTVQPAGVITVSADALQFGDLCVDEGAQRIVTLTNRMASAITVKSKLVGSGRTPGGSSISAAPETVTVPAHGSADVVVSITAGPSGEAPFSRKLLLGLGSEQSLREVAITGAVIAPRFELLGPVPSSAISSVLSLALPSVRPGDSSESELTLRNTGTVSFTFETNAGPAGEWFDFLPPSGSVPPGGSTVIRLARQAPPDSLRGYAAAGATCVSSAICSITVAGSRQSCVEFQARQAVGLPGVELVGGSYLPRCRLDLSDVLAAGEAAPALRGAITVGNSGGADGAVVVPLHSPLRLSKKVPRSLEDTDARSLTVPAGGRLEVVARAFLDSTISHKSWSSTLSIHSKVVTTLLSDASTGRKEMPCSSFDFALQGADMEVVKAPSAVIAFVRQVSSGQESVYEAEMSVANNGTDKQLRLKLTGAATADGVRSVEVGVKAQNTVSAWLPEVFLTVEPRQQRIIGVRVNAAADAAPPLNGLLGSVTLQAENAYDISAAGNLEQKMHTVFLTRDDSTPFMAACWDRLPAVCATNLCAHLLEAAATPATRNAVWSVLPAVAACQLGAALLQDGGGGSVGADVAAAFSQASDPLAVIKEAVRMCTLLVVGGSTVISLDEMAEQGMPLSGKMVALLAEGDLRTASAVFAVIMTRVLRAASQQPGVAASHKAATAVQAAQLMCFTFGKALPLTQPPTGSAQPGGASFPESVPAQPLLFSVLAALANSSFAASYRVQHRAFSRLLEAMPAQPAGAAPPRSLGEYVGAVLDDAVWCSATTPPAVDVRALVACLGPLARAGPAGSPLTIAEAILARVHSAGGSPPAALQGLFQQAVCAAASGDKQPARLFVSVRISALCEALVNLPALSAGVRSTFLMLRWLAFGTGESIALRQRLEPVLALVEAHFDDPYTVTTTPMAARCRADSAAGARSRAAGGMLFVASLNIVGLSNQARAAPRACLGVACSRRRPAPTVFCTLMRAPSTTSLSSRVTAIPSAHTLQADALADTLHAEEAFLEAREAGQPASAREVRSAACRLIDTVLAPLSGWTDLKSILHLSLDPPEADLTAGVLLARVFLGDDSKEVVPTLQKIAVVIRQIPDEKMTAPPHVVSEAVDRIKALASCLHTMQTRLPVLSEALDILDFDIMKIFGASTTALRTFKGGLSKLCTIAAAHKGTPKVAAAVVIFVTHLAGHLDLRETERLGKEVAHLLIGGTAAQAVASLADRLAGTLAARGALLSVSHLGKSVARGCSAADAAEQAEQAPMATAVFPPSAMTALQDLCDLRDAVAGLLSAWPGEQEPASGTHPLLAVPIRFAEVARAVAGRLAIGDRGATAAALLEPPALVRAIAAVACSGPPAGGVDAVIAAPVVFAAAAQFLLAYAPLYCANPEHVLSPVPGVSAATVISTARKRLTVRDAFGPAAEAALVGIAAAIGRRQPAAGAQGAEEIPAAGGDEAAAPETHAPGAAPAGRVAATVIDAAVQSTGALVAMISSALRSPTCLDAVAQIQATRADTLPLQAALQVKFAVGVRTAAREWTKAFAEAAALMQRGARSPELDALLGQLLSLGLEMLRRAEVVRVAAGCRREQVTLAANIVGEEVQAVQQLFGGVPASAWPDKVGKMLELLALPSVAADFVLANVLQGTVEDDATDTDGGDRFRDVVPQDSGGAENPANIDTMERGVRLGAMGMSTAGYADDFSQTFAAKSGLQAIVKQKKATIEVVLRVPEVDEDDEDGDEDPDSRTPRGPWTKDNGEERPTVLDDEGGGGGGSTEPNGPGADVNVRKKGGGRSASSNEAKDKELKDLKNKHKVKAEPLSQVDVSDAETFVANLKITQAPELDTKELPDLYNRGRTMAARMDGKVVDLTMELGSVKKAENWTYNALVKTRAIARMVQQMSDVFREVAAIQLGKAGNEVRRRGAVCAQICSNLPPPCSSAASPTRSACAAALCATRSWK